MSDTGRFRSIFREGLFEDTTALVTGGGTGIGRCIAHELAALGANVVLSGRRAEPLEQTAAEITRAGGKAEAAVMDIRDEAMVERVVGELVARHGPIGALVNNAGGQFAAPAVQIPPKGWRAVIDTNLNGTFWVSRAVFKACMNRHGGAIVTIVADMWNGFPGMAHTGAARAGVVNLTKTLALEWAGAGVRINAVAPGFVLSSGLKSYPPAIQKEAARLFRENPAGRAATESEVSAAVAFLLSPAGTYINGATLRVDGGASLWKAPLLPLTHPKQSARFDGFHLPADVPGIFLDDEGDAEG